MKKIEEINSEPIRYGFSDEMLRDSSNKFKLSPELVDFYSNFHFNNTLNVEGILIYSLEDLEKENSDYFPSYLLAEIGYITFSSFGNGYALCVKVDSPETTVYEASHDIISEDTSKDEIPTLLKPVRRSFIEVLGLALEGKLY